jgi:hypothetical protein
MKLILATLLALLSAVPAMAQWQTPTHSVPIGQGSGQTGFNSVGPCTSGAIILGQGASADPVCSSALGFYFHKNGTAQTSMTNSAYAQVTWSTTKFNTTGNSLSSNRWTAPSTGLVFMEATAYYTAHVVNSASSNLVLKIIKNSAGTCNGTDVFAGQGAAFFGVSGFATGKAVGVDSATANDVYEVCSFAVSDDALNDIQMDGNMAHTHWSGAYIR